MPQASLCPFSLCLLLFLFITLQAVTQLLLSFLRSLLKLKKKTWMNRVNYGVWGPTLRNIGRGYANCIQSSFVITRTWQVRQWRIVVERPCRPRVALHVGCGNLIDDVEGRLAASLPSAERHRRVWGSRMLTAEVIVLVIVIVVIIIIIILSQSHHYVKIALSMLDEVPTLSFYVFLHLCLDTGTYCLVLCLFVSKRFQKFRLYSVRILGCSK